MSKPTALVIGAGIVGLAVARALGERGHQVTVLERSPQAVGASIRNFGMVWPIGQPVGRLYERALRSRSIWKDLLNAGGIWHRETGSLLVARKPEEMAVLEEFIQRDGRSAARLCNPADTVALSPAVKPEGLLGGLHSTDELIVDPREAIVALPGILSAQYGTIFHFSTTVTRIEHPVAYTSTRRFEADRIFVCSGPDFETLYPEHFAQTPITKCKVQMLRTSPQPGGWNIGASLSAGLTLIHYKAFEDMPSLPALRSLYEKIYPKHIHWGVHVLVSQNGAGGITLGDTHEYGLHLDPFDRHALNDLVFEYLNEFAAFPDMRVAETWHGIYPKMTDGSTEVVLQPEPGVTIINGLGGAGMTMSFGLAEEVVADNGVPVGA
jgi:FAD dependent oxidoreductase TIGR03364